MTVTKDLNRIATEHDILIHSMSATDESTTILVEIIKPKKAVEMPDDKALEALQHQLEIQHERPKAVAILKQFIKQIIE